jgi:hypothetical protein
MGSAMRGYLAPAKRSMKSDAQTRFASLSRGRRTKLAKAAGTTLVKADQWARGGAVPAAISSAIEGQLAKLKAPAKAS